MNNIPDSGLSFAAMRALNLRSRLEYAHRAGITYEGKRDVDSALGYEKCITPEQYRERYERGGIAKTIVNAPTNATWRGEIMIVDQEMSDDGQKDQDASDFEESLRMLDRRIHFWNVFYRADILSAITGFSIILVGAPGDISEPLPENLTADDIAYLATYGKDTVRLGERETDRMSPDFGKPKYYSFGAVCDARRRKGTGGYYPSDARFYRSETNVHPSRVIHVAEGLLDECIEGTPHLEAVWNYLDDLTKVVGAGAEAFWAKADMGLQVDIPLEAAQVPNATDQLLDDLEAYRHGLTRTIRTTGGADITPLAAPVTSMTSSVESLVKLIAATNRIPQRILMGSERAHLSSTQDRVNWQERIEERRRQFAEPVILFPFVDLLIKSGVVPMPMDGEYSVSWPSLEEQLSLMDRAKIAQIMATINREQGDGSKAVYSGDEIREVTGHMPVGLSLDDMRPADRLQERDQSVSDMSQPGPSVSPMMS